MLLKKNGLAALLKSKNTSVILSLILGCASAEAVFAQNSLQNNVYGNSQPKTTRRKAIPKPTAAPPQETRPVRSERPKAIIRSRRADLQLVTFVTQEPLSEIWLNDRMLGQTNGDRKLVRKLVIGDYRVMVKKNNRIIFPVQKITISNSSNTFNLFPQIVDKAGVDEPKPVKRVDGVKPTNLQQAVEISAEVKRILTDYNNPETTDTITTGDWELVLKAAQLGQFQDYTAVQIEAQRWFASGQIEVAKENYPNAFTAFTKSEEFMPQSGLPFYGLGTAYLANKQPLEAVKAFQRALQLSPKMAMAYRKLGDAQRLLGHQKEAASAYSFAIDNGYKTPETRFWFGTTQLQLKKTEDGIKQLEEVVKEWQKPEVYVAIGDGYLQLKRGVSAIAAYQKAIELDPANAVAHYKIGTIYFDQREYQVAKESFQKAADLDPEGKTTNKNEVQKRLREAASKIK